MNFHTTSRLAANHKENVRLHLPLVATLLVIIYKRAVASDMHFKTEKSNKKIALVDDQMSFGAHTMPTPIRCPISCNCENTKSKRKLFLRHLFSFGAKHTGPRLTMWWSAVHHLVGWQAACRRSVCRPLHCNSHCVRVRFERLCVAYTFTYV